MLHITGFLIHMHLWGDVLSQSKPGTYKENFPGSATLSEGSFVAVDKIKKE